MLSPEIKRHYDAFWHCEAHERCCLQLYSPSGEVYESAPARDVNEHWENVIARAEREEGWMRTKKLHADAFNTVFVNFGPGSLAACLKGGSYKWAWDTVWFENEPLIRDFSAPPEIALDPDSRVYALVESYTKILLARGAGSYYTSICDIGGLFDIIAALRGTQALLTDLFDYEDEVNAFAEKLARVWCDYFKAQSSRLLRAQGGMTSWMPIYSDKSYYPLQCDFSAMISPAMFKKFVLPGLEYLSEHMERSIYHLDGPGEIPHIDMLLSLPRLNAIQWVAGSGAAPLTDMCWFDMYKRIQRAGKGLVLLRVEPEGLEKLLENISSRGLLISVYANDDSQAREITRICELAGKR